MNLKSFFAILFAILCPSFALAQEEEPIITFHTTIYEDSGESNSFSIAIGANCDGQYVDIDCGYGPEELEVTQAYLGSDSTLHSSYYSGKVSKEGIVKIYGDPTKIDYFNASGCYIDRIEFNPNLALEILNLEYNTLKTLNVDSLKHLNCLYLCDNPFTKETPLKIGYLPKLLVLEIPQVGYVSEDFDLRNFPLLTSFDAYHCLTLKKADTSECPYLASLSLDMTSVDAVDVTMNNYLEVLNISDSRIRNIDVTNNSKLMEFYCTHASGTINTDIKLQSLDVSGNPELQVLFCGGNNLETIDVSNNPKLFDFSAHHNKLHSIDLSNNTEIYNVNLGYNYLDFATLPTPLESWGDYEYQQHDIELNDTYKEGDVIDLSSRVLRAGTETDAVMYMVPKDDPTNYVEAPDSCYSYADGKVTLLTPMSEKCLIAFTNDVFCDYPLYTETFSVKKESEFGKDTKAVEFATNMTEGNVIDMSLGILGATPENPVSVKADFGDGKLQSFTVKSEKPESKISGKRASTGNIIIYVPQDHYVTGITTDGVSITNINLSELTELNYLNLRNAELYNIDLSYNANLLSLDLSGNNLYTLDLQGPSYYFYKSRLSDINASNNNIHEFHFNDLYAIKKLNLSGNQLSSVDFSDADNLLEADLSNNLFEELSFNYSDSLRSINVSNNNLTSLYIPADAPLEYYNISGNKFTLADMADTLIALSSKLPKLDCIYAPQQPYQIASNGPGANVSSQLVDVDGQKTQFTWKNENGDILSEGTDYTTDAEYGAASVKFLRTDMGKVYCEMTHPALPLFTGDNAYKTTLITPIAMPTVEIASFTITESTDSVELSLAAMEDGTSVYFDWNGDGNVTQYTLGTTYKLFYANTVAGKKVRVLLADENDKVNIFSITGAKMTDLNVDGLDKAFAITIANAGLTEFSTPRFTSLGELNLSGNNLSDIDLGKYPNLIYLSMNSNKFQSIDLGKVPDLQLAYLGNNDISSIAFNNSMLWNLDLGNNNLSEFSYEGAEGIEQLWLNGNNLSTIDLDGLSKLKVLSLVSNRFDFSTLPVQKSSWVVYDYGKQADLDVTPSGNVLDLSYMAAVGDSVTAFRWFIGKPTQNEDTEEWEGEELIEGEEYTTENGVTTFHFENDVDGIVGLMTNPQFPNLTLFTKEFDVVVAPASKRGDVNKDGVVDIADVNTVLSVIFDSTEYVKDADVNEDGIVDIADVNAVLTIMYTE